MESTLYKVNLRANHTHSCHKLLAFIAPPTTHQLSRHHNLCARLPTLITTFHSLPRRTHVLCAIVLRVRPTRLTFLRVRLTLLLLPGMLTSPPPCSAYNNIGQHSREIREQQYSTYVHREKTLPNHQKLRSAYERDCCEAQIFEMPFPPPVNSDLEPCSLYVEGLKFAHSHRALSRMGLSLPRINAPKCFYLLITGSRQMGPSQRRRAMLSLRTAITDRFCHLRIATKFFFTRWPLFCHAPRMSTSALRPVGRSVFFFLHP